MASNTFTRTDVNGNSRTYSRKGTQGRTKSNLPLKTSSVLIHLTEKDKIEFSSFCKRLGMSESSAGELALFTLMRDIELSVSDNCFKQ